jgi:hypothetical protein
VEVPEGGEDEPDCGVGDGFGAGGGGVAVDDALGVLAMSWRGKVWRCL